MAEASKSREHLEDKGPDCPEAETLVCFAEKRLAKERRPEVIQHISLCDECRTGV